MDIKDLKPRTGAGSLRIADSDELVVMEHFGGVPAGRVRPLDHGLVIICTAGVAQFEYDGHTVQLSKNDLFLSLADLLPLKHNPKVTLSDVDAALFETYFKQLSYHIRNSSQLLYPEITHSIVGAFLLEVLSVLRRGNNILKDNNLINNSGLHGRKLADRFVQLVEQSDGRIRRVDEFAQMLNVTPKYLSKLLMDTMHRKPSVIVAFFTLQAIENRLRYTDMTMQQIADDLHFANASFFGKYFKEHSGMTPMEYRIKYHQDEKK